MCVRILAGGGRSAFDSKCRSSGRQRKSRNAGTRSTKTSCSRLLFLVLYFFLVQRQLRMRKEWNIGVGCYGSLANFCATTAHVLGASPSGQVSHSLWSFSLAEICGICSRWRWRRWDLCSPEACKSVNKLAAIRRRLLDDGRQCHSHQSKAPQLPVSWPTI